MKSILLGVFLGLAIIAGWINYPAVRGTVDHAVSKAREIKAMIPEEMMVREPVPARKEADKPEGNAGLSEPAEETPPLLQEQSEPIELPPVSTEPEIKRYVFWEFDELRNAESFIASVRKRADIDLWLDQDGYKYIVYLPAEDEQGRMVKAKIIQLATGIKSK